MKRKRKADSTVAREIRALDQAHKEHIQADRWVLAGRATCEKQALEWAYGIDTDKPSIAHHN